MSLLKPYLAIVIDSFHSALASRVLWAAMLAIWLLLASLAPIGLREDYTTKFRWFDIYNGTRMKALLAQGMVDPKSKDQAIGRIAAEMPDELKRKLQRVGEGDEVRIRLNLLTDALNDLVESDANRVQDEVASAAGQPRDREPGDNDDPGDSNKSRDPNEPKDSNEPKDTDETKDSSENSNKGWYDSNAWKSTVRLRELRELDEAADADLELSLRQRRARLRIEAALPGVFEARSARSVLLTYAGLDFPTDFQIDRSQFETIFNQFVIPILVNWLLGLVLVFLGVLVTASIVPDMLQTGSLHLLLSKPISRWALITSKFVGGCAFVLLCVTQLVIGLYLIAALRLGVWNGRILWCIPVALLIFAVFYSVSVLAGLKWRSAIISIAAAGALAAICVVVGIIGGVIDARVVQPDRIASMTTAGPDLFAITGGSGLVRLNEQTQQWDSLIGSEAMSNDRILQPVAMDEDHLLTARIRNGRFNPFGSGSLDLIVLSRDEDWKPQPTLRLPTATERLVMIGADEIAAINTADLLLTSRDKVLESLGSPNENDAEDSSDANTSDGDAQSDKPARSRNRQPAAKSVGSWLRALVTMQGGATEDFTSILPREISLSPPARIVSIDGEDTLIVMTGDRLFRLQRPASEGAEFSPRPWSITAKGEIPDGEDSAGPVIAASPKHVLVARGSLPLQIFDAETLGLLGQWEDDQRQEQVNGTPIELVSITGNRFIYRTTSGHADVLQVVGDADPSASQPEDAGDQAFIRWEQRININEIQSLHWAATPGSTTDDNTDAKLTTLSVAHHVDRVSRFAVSDSGEFRWVDTTTPRRSVWRWIDHYVIGALEWMTPQVLQLGDTTAAMVSGNQSMVIGGGDWGDQEVVRYQIMRPLISCFLFIFATLLVACWYFGRADF